MLATLTRSERRAASRDDARAHPVPAREPSHGLVGEIVHQRHGGRVPYQGTCSGQRRVNAKRNARAELWRTVTVRVSDEIEPYFRRSIHLLGDGARVQGRSIPLDWFGVDLAVHIPGAPATAVRAMPAYRSVWRGDRYEPELDSVTWIDADGRHFEAEAN
jgi:hypothetical protein